MLTNTNRRDVLFAVILALAAAIGSFVGAGSFERRGVEIDDMVFGADIPRVYSNMTDLGSSHYRTKVHPVFSLVSYPPVLLLHKAAGLSQFDAVRAVFAVVGGLWAAAMFALLRLFGCRGPDAGLMTAIGVVSASWMVFFTIPETYAFGSLSIVLVLVFAAAAETRRFGEGWFVAASALSLSMTTTNWMAGGLVTLVHHPLRRTVQITANALCVIVLLWAVQKAIFPSAKFFLGDREEHRYLLLERTLSPLHIVASYLFHSVVFPALSFVDKGREFPILGVQPSMIGSSGPVGIIATAAWGGLLGLGIWAFATIRELGRFRLTVTGLLLGQLALHLVYGEETFLYSLHWLPALLVVASASLKTHLRPYALALAAVLFVSLSVNNLAQWREAAEYFATVPGNWIGTEGRP